MIELMVRLDGKPVPLAACEWVRYAPCGCPTGSCYAVIPLGGEMVADEPHAWAEFYPRRKEREAAIKRGVRVELMTRDRWKREVMPKMLPSYRCPHYNQTTEETDQ